MRVSYQSVNFQADQKLVDFLEKKIAGLDKFHDKIIAADVFLKVQKTSEKENKITELNIKIPGSDLVVKKDRKTFEEAISLSVDSMKRQLKKSKEKERFLSAHKK